MGKTVFGGCFNLDEEMKAAHASDTLARKLMKNGEYGHQLNFYHDETEVVVEKRKKMSRCLGVTWDKKQSKWRVERWSKIEKKMIYKGRFNAHEETKAVHASDTLARELMKNGENGHHLNFPDDKTKERLEKGKNNKRKRSEESKDGSDLN